MLFELSLMHLADAFIQSDLHCIQSIHFIIPFHAFPGNQTNDLGIAIAIVSTLLEEMVLFRTRNGSIPRFIHGTPKWFYIEQFFQ